jgi:hypothetical protein
MTAAAPAATSPALDPAAKAGSRRRARVLSCAMSARLDGAGASIERWLSGLSGPELVAPEITHATEPPSDGDVKCPICDRPRNDLAEADERYDEDFDYYWGDFRLPLWIALIWQVPWRQRLDIFVIGFSIGLIIAGIAVFWGLLLAQY